MKTLDDYLIVDLSQKSQIGVTVSHKAALKIIVEFRNKVKRTGSPLVGELTTSPPGASINVADISHSISTIRVENGKIIGTVHLLDTPKGNIAQSLHDAGVQLKFGMRAYVRQQQGDVINDLDFITFDLIGNP